MYASTFSLNTIQFPSIQVIKQLSHKLKERLMTKEIQEAIKSLQEKMHNEEIDGSIKFEIENVGSIVIDAGVVKESNDETDCTLSGELETFMEIFRGDTSSTAAFMGGKLKIDGSMGTAMKYNTILS